jgi:hypothetical protein
MFTGEAHMTNHNIKSIRATVLPPYDTARKAFAGYCLASYTSHDCRSQTNARQHPQSTPTRVSRELLDPRTSSCGLEPFHPAASLKQVRRYSGTEPEGALPGRIP